MYPIKTSTKNVSIYFQNILYHDLPKTNEELKKKSMLIWVKIIVKNNNGCCAYNIHSNIYPFKPHRFFISTKIYCKIYKKKDIIKKIWI